MQDNFGIRNLLAIWLKPRKTISTFLEKKNRSVHLKIILVSAFLYSLQFITLLAILDLLPNSNKATPWFLFQGVFWLFLLVLALYITLSNGISLIIQFLVRSLGGKGNILETKTVVYWSSLCFLPVTLLYLLFNWNFMLSNSAREKGLEFPFILDILQILTAIGILGFFIQGLIVLSKMLSEVHKFSVWRAIIAAFGGVICILLGIIVAFYML